MKIEGKDIGTGAPTYVIAEVGINHMGDVALAEMYVDVAARAGADAVKFQTVDADASYAAGTASHAVFREAGLTEADYERLLRCARRAGITCFTTPGDAPSVALAGRLGFPAVKVSSGLMTDHAHLDRVAALDVPIIVSTGMSHLDEVRRTVARLERSGRQELALLHCVSVYPAAASLANLLAIETMRAAFPYPIGYSDHVTGDLAVLVAVSRGAAIIEKHLVLDETPDAPDAHVSLPPDAFAAMVRKVRDVERMLGDGEKRPRLEEERGRTTFRRRLVAATDIPQGAVIDGSMVVAKRTGKTGVEAHDYDDVVGRRTARPLQRDQPLAWQDLEGSS